MNNKTGAAILVASMVISGTGAVYAQNSQPNNTKTAPSDNSSAVFRQKLGTSFKNLVAANTDESKIIAAEELQTLLKTKKGQKFLKQFKAPKQEDSKKTPVNLTEDQKMQLEEAKNNLRVAAEEFKKTAMSFGVKPGVKPELTDEQKQTLKQLAEKVKIAADELKDLAKSFGITLPKLALPTDQVKL